MSPWIRDRNCFATRYKLDPNRREDFIQALNDLGDFAEPYYHRGCRFAFQGYCRDPNEFIVIASWDEEVVTELRDTEEFQSCNQRMLDCVVEPVVMEQFCGADIDRTVFEKYPAGSSEVHDPSEKQSYIFL